MKSVALTRRHFLRITTAVSGGLLIGFYLHDSAAASIQPQAWTSLPQGAEINAWLAIDSEGNVTIRVHHAEMGQGALTSVLMMIAEELNVDWTRVRRQHPHIMRAGASARERLKEAAAHAWGVDRSAVVARLGTLTSGTHTGSYAEFATAAASITLAEEPAIKKPGEWWLLGKPLDRLDVAVKTDDSAIKRRPGIHAVIALKAQPGKTEGRRRAAATTFPA